MATSSRESVHIMLPRDLVKTLWDEAKLRKAPLTAIIEERCRAVAPLHDKLDRMQRRIEDELFWGRKK
jgi:hypothetical protein